MMVRQVPSPEVAERLEQGEPLTIIDVRTPAEYAEGHVPGSRLVPLDQLPMTIGELPKDRTLYLMCRSGSRSDFAGNWLAQQGYDVVNIAGGMLQWTGPLAYGLTDGEANEGNE